MKYQPKRSSQRWLLGAPDYVLAVYDTGKQWYNDRYTVMFGGRLWDASMGRTVNCLYLGESGAQSSGEQDASTRRGKKIRWMDLPPTCMAAVREWAREDVTLFDCGMCGGLHLPTFEGDCRDNKNRFNDEEDFCKKKKLLCTEVKFVIDSWAERVADLIDLS